jgi:protein SCO1/2
MVKSGSIITLLLLVLGAFGTHPARAAGYSIVDPPRPLADIELVAKGDSRIDKTALAGRWTFLTLGFTHCPDVCPTILGNLSAVRAELATALDGKAVPRMIFVSVDPARDDPAYLAGYVANFGAGLVGATGSKAAIDRLVRQLGAYYRLRRKDKDGFYGVDHSGEVYLIDPQVRLRARFIPILDPKRTVQDFLAISGDARPRADAVPRTR